MEIRSLLDRTDMIFHRFDGVVTDHGSFLSVETPTNPGFYWGNYLLFSTPPQKEDFIHWRSHFQNRFKANPKVRHETYAWETIDGVEPVLEPFLNAGFRLDKMVVFAANQIQKPKKWNGQIDVRPLIGDCDWDCALENHTAIYKKEFKEDVYRTYRKRKNDRYRRMIRAGLGQWFGAFLNGRLVGDMGIFKNENLARFQLVSTHPDFCRQGICSTLLYKTCIFGLEKMKVDQLVIAADEDYFAKDIYQSIGFKLVERKLGLEKRPPEEVQ